ncbi:MAG: hybrid sensor histidine kinase/response regulator [Roseateles sp.]|uniref:hybrid sensor histidine kinase/response regulator n=1 Tax=Roseateles sp. TaxID=1971397 RepID=UPI00403675D9
MNRRFWPWQARQRYRPLSHRYALGLSGVTLSLLLLSGTSEMYFGYRESLQGIEAVQEALAEGAAREIAAYLGTVDTGLRDVAKMPWGRPGFGLAQRREEFYRLMQIVPAITDLQVVNRAGREQLATSKHAADREGSNQLIEDPLIAAIGPHDGVRRGRTFFRDGYLPTLRMAIFDGQDAIVATVDLRLLGDVVARLRTGEAGLAYIVDADGMLIAHPKATHALSRIDLSRSEAVRQARASATSAAGLIRGLATHDMDGRPVITTAAAVPGTGWLVFMEQTRSEALKPTWSTLTRTLLLMALGVGAALVFGIAFARRMAAPIVALRQATARIASGDLETSLKVNRHDEIEDLAQDFNQMASRLRDLYASLEAKVAHRTAELSDARDVLTARANELSLLKDEAERANAAKTRFLAAASHDLRQPMHSISLLIGVLRTRLADPAQIDLADKVQSSVTTMENLFGNLLDISKLDAGAVHPHIEDVDLGWLLERAAQTWLPQAQEKGLSLRVRPGRCVVRGDATLLERIVGNLLANAIRYTRIGGVLVGCRRRGERCELQIWDSGPGIAPEHLDAIFEEFFRIGAPGTGQEKGLGLGLSIVRRCAHILGYSVTVQSREGRGSVFKVLLPLVAGAAASPAAAGAINAPLQALDGNFVVVVDDEATNREAVRDALLAAGCHVVIAANGADALAQLAAHLRTPDVILTDFQLGTAGDGLDVIRRLRALYDEAIPALVVTANTDTRLPAEAAALGAGLLHKPVGLQRLLLALKESLETAPRSS